MLNAALQKRQPVMPKKDVRHTVMGYTGVIKFVHEQMLDALIYDLRLLAGKECLRSELWAAMIPGVQAELDAAKKAVETAEKSVKTADAKVKKADKDAAAANNGEPPQVRTKEQRDVALTLKEANMALADAQKQVVELEEQLLALEQASQEEDVIKPRPELKIRFLGDHQLNSFMNWKAFSRTSTFGTFSIEITANKTYGHWSVNCQCSSFRNRKPGDAYRQGYEYWKEVTGIDLTDYCVQPELDVRRRR